MTSSSMRHRSCDWPPCGRSSQHCARGGAAQQAKSVSTPPERSIPRPGIPVSHPSLSRLRSCRLSRSSQPCTAPTTCPYTPRRCQYADRISVPTRVAPHVFCVGRGESRGRREGKRRSPALSCAAHEFRKSCAVTPDVTSHSRVCKQAQYLAGTISEAKIRYVVAS